MVESNAGVVTELGDISLPSCRHGGQNAAASLQDVGVVGTGEALGNVCARAAHGVGVWVNQARESDETRAIDDSFGVRS